MRSIELLATLMPYPIQFESRRRSLQRFLKLGSLNIESLWFPLVKEILQAKCQKSKPLKLAIDRTLRANAKYIYDQYNMMKQSISLYWQLLDKKGSSNICQQQALIAPVLELLSDYEVSVLGDREFGSLKLAYWLCQKQVKFILRVKQGDISNQKMLITSAYLTWF